MATAITSYKQRYESAIARARRIKEAAQAPVKASLLTISGVTGGIAHGAIAAKLPQIGPVPTAPVVGGGFVLMGLLNADEEWAQNANAFGTALLACSAGRETYRLLTTP